MNETLFINGRFLSQRTTGVQRYCIEIIKALDSIATALPPLVILAPKNSTPLPLKNIEIRQIGCMQGTLWEQFTLPRYTKNNLLICLANTGPLRHKGNLFLFIHDLGVYSTPTAYTKGFVAWYTFLLPKLVKKAQVFTVSNFSKEEISERLRIETSKVGVIPCGGDHLSNITKVDLSQLSSPLPNKYLLAVGSLNPNKNIELLIRAFFELKDRDLHLVLVGNKNDKIFQDVSLTKSDRVHWISDVCDGKLKTLYENAQLFVFPSLYEGFGIPPFEALFCGCPVLLSDIRPFTDQWPDGVHYFNSGSVEDLKQQITLSLNKSHPVTDNPKYNATWQSYKWKNSAKKLLDAINQHLIPS